jgi:hypothetical protein
MAKDKEETVEATPVVVNLVDPNTGIEVVPVPDTFDAHVKSLGYDGPCKDC